MNSQSDCPELRRYLQGCPPLPARLEDWQRDLLSQPERLARQVSEYGSPLNLHSTSPFRRNVRHLRRVAAERNLDFEIFFARKANKCLAYVETARELGIGVDVASPNELRQTLAAGIPPEQIVITAAVKTEELYQLAAQAGALLVLDNRDEWTRAEQAARVHQRTLPVALRIGGFIHQGQKLPTRFGFDRDRVAAELQELEPPGSCLQIVGLHFHLDGYNADQRINALRQCLELAERCRSAGHPVRFIDMGGGFPMSYLLHRADWDRFWATLDQAAKGSRPPITWNNETWGRGSGGTEKPRLYPCWQEPVQEHWLAGILDAPAEPAAGSLAEALRRAALQLRCEPGRSLLDGCGLTCARVEFRKQLSGGDWLIGLAMNRTQHRTTGADFLVDPLLVPVPELPRPGACEGWLVGACCLEGEFLTARKLAFPLGVQPGDLIVFPNTAGYLMHFLESRSHQFDLARNCLWTDGELRLDEIDEV